MRLTFLEDGEGSWFGPEFWDPGWVGYITLLSPFLDPVPGEEIEGLPLLVSGVVGGGMARR